MKAIKILKLISLFLILSCSSFAQSKSDLYDLSWNFDQGIDLSRFIRKNGTNVPGLENTKKFILPEGTLYAIGNQVIRFCIDTFDYSFFYMEPVISPGNTFNGNYQSSYPLENQIAMVKKAQKFLNEYSDEDLEGIPGIMDGKTNLSKKVKKLYELILIDAVQDTVPNRLVCKKGDCRIYMEYDDEKLVIVIDRSVPGLKSYRFYWDAMRPVEEGYMAHCVDCVDDIHITIEEDIDVAIAVIKSMDTSIVSENKN